MRKAHFLVQLVDSNFGRHDSRKGIEVVACVVGVDGVLKDGFNMPEKRMSACRTSTAEESSEKHTGERCTHGIYNQRQYSQPSNRNSLRPIIKLSLFRAAREESRK